MTRFEQFGQLAGLREVRPEVMAFGVCVARGTLIRLDRAFTAFFRRLKAGQDAGAKRTNNQREHASCYLAGPSCEAGMHITRSEEDELSLVGACPAQRSGRPGAQGR